MALSTETYQYVMHHALEKAYQEYMSCPNPISDFETWINSTEGKVHLAELVLNDIDMIGGIKLILNFRHNKHSNSFQNGKS